MEKYLIFVLCVILSSTVALPSKPKTFRNDYEYNPKTDAFYKLHIEDKYTMNVKSLCEVEGAALMMISSDDDIRQLQYMARKFQISEKYVWVGDDGKKHVFAEDNPHDSPYNMYGPPNYDEKTLPFQFRCAVVNLQKGEVETMTCLRFLPFICKVAAKDLSYNEDCDLYAKAYRYYPSVGSCYKVPRMAFTWSEAYSYCQAEGSHLLVVNSEAECEVITNVTNAVQITDTLGMKCSRYHKYCLAGFRADKPVENAPVVFKTIFNQTLEEAGFSAWMDNEPNNLEGKEYCGSVSRETGKLNDIDCKENNAFICEKEISKLS